MPRPLTDDAWGIYKQLRTARLEWKHVKNGFIGRPEDARARQALPQCQNLDGRPVWEPPIFDYSDLIGEEYEKKRKAVLEHYGGDVVKATSFLDADIEADLLYIYVAWIDKNARMTKQTRDSEGEAFYNGLQQELDIDLKEANDECWDFGLTMFVREDGTYRVKADSEDSEAEGGTSDSGSGYTSNNEGSLSNGDSDLQSQSSSEYDEGEERHYPGPTRWVQTQTQSRTSFRSPPPTPLAFLLHFAQNINAQNISDSETSNGSSSSDEDVD